MSSMVSVFSTRPGKRVRLKVDTEVPRAMESIVSVFKGVAVVYLA